MHVNPPCLRQNMHDPARAVPQRCLLIASGNEMSVAENTSSFFLSLTIFDFILATLTICGNILLLITILFDPLRCLRTPTTYFIANLAFSDLLIGLLIGSGRAVIEYLQYVDQAEPKWIATVFNIGGGAALVSGIWTVIALVLDRYVAVTDPLHYTERVTARRVAFYILLSWPVAMALPVPYSFAGKVWPIILLAFSHTHFTIPVLLLLIVYFRIFRSLSRRRSELLRLTASISTMTLRHTLEREKKMASTSLMILILFCASFLPFYIKIQILNFCKCLDSKPYRTFSWVVHIFLYLSSLMDPFMYAWRVPKFRRSFRECFKIKKRNNVRPAKTLNRERQRQNNVSMTIINLDSIV